KREGTGLEYKRHRYYDPTTGRFTQPDPIGLAGGLNLYGFANGDPVNFSDPFGLVPCTNAELAAGKETVANKGGAICVEGRDYDTVFGSMTDFIDNYADMREANTIGADKFFHAKANCQAAQRGPVGTRTAAAISNVREWTDQHIKGDPAEASKEDQAANVFGRSAGGRNPRASCSQLVGKFRPKGLNPKY
ncbi:MAG: RHS repeat-associated core domain-containing protein, partial [Gemmatimonadales bacterium]|nr:RHS repeat-associated core domain-containing protein [Gemmatimonadales bacterium]